MSQNEIVVDVQALDSVSTDIKTYVKNYRESLQDAVRSLKQNSEEWNDEDFNALISAFSKFEQDFEEIENGSNQLVKRAGQKISAIHELHNIKI